jgi:hypothetical protein
MGFIVIDYNTLILVTVFAFAAIGLSRGWLTEFINTVLLTLLSILLIKPDLLKPVLEKLNQLLRLILALLKSGFSFEPDKLTAAYQQVDNAIDPSNPYPVLLLLTIALLALQYAGTRIKFTGALTPFSRILGAILGAVNANIVVSLVKELIRRHTQVQLRQVSAQQVTIVQAQLQSVQALAPNGVAMALEDAPAGFLPEAYWVWIGGAVLAIAAVLLLSRYSKKPIGTP